MRLIGDDATLESFSKGEDVQGDGVSSLSELTGIEHPLYYIISKVAKDEMFLNNHTVGDVYYSLRGNEILSEGTVFTPLNSTNKLAYAKNLIIDLSYSEIDMTTIDDEVPKYVKSIGDAKGSMSIQIDSESLKDMNSIYNRFIKMSNIDINTGSNVIKDISNDYLFLNSILYSKDNGEQVSLFAQVEIYNLRLGANMGSALEYSSNIRFTGANPVMLVISDGKTY